MNGVSGQGLGGAKLVRIPSHSTLLISTIKRTWTVYEIETAGQIWPNIFSRPTQRIVWCTAPCSGILQTVKIIEENAETVGPWISPAKNRFILRTTPSHVSIPPNQRGTMAKVG